MKAKNVHGIDSIVPYNGAISLSFNRPMRRKPHERSAFQKRPYLTQRSDASRYHLPSPTASLHLADVAGKAVELDFDGGLLSSDAGLVLLKDIDAQLGLSHALATVLKDPRDL